MKSIISKFVSNHLQSNGIAHEDSLKLDVLGNLSFEGGESTQVPAVCVVIAIPRYIELLESLSIREVAPQRISHSMEVYFTKLAEVLLEFGGDIVKVMNDRIVAVWRLNPLQSNNNNHDAVPEQYKMVMATAVLACLLCTEMLREYYLWALEDISPEFEKIKIDGRFGIAFGHINDNVVGIKGYKIEHCISGSAYIKAMNAQISTTTEDNLKIPVDMYKHISQYLDHSGITVSFDDLYYTVRSCGNIDPKNIHDIYSQVGAEPSNSENSNIKTDYEVFISDAALALIKSTGLQKLANGYNVASWKHVSFISICCPTIAFADKLFELVLKSCRKYDVLFHNLSLDPNGNLLISCLTIENEGQQLNPDLVTKAIRLAIYLQTSLNASNLPTVSIQIRSGKIFEGILCNSNRFFYRLIGQIREDAECQSHMPGIFADSNTYLSSIGSTLQGLFKKISGEDSQAIYRIGLFGVEKPNHAEKVRLNDSETYQRIANILQDHDKQKTAKNVLIEGPAGTGKTAHIRNLKSMLEKHNYVICFAEALENEQYQHPLLVYTEILPRLVDALESIASNTSTLKSNKKPLLGKNLVKSVRERGASSSLIATFKGSENSTSQTKGTFSNLKSKFSKNLTRITPINEISSAPKESAVDQADSQNLLDISDSSNFASLKQVMERAAENLNLVMPLLSVLISNTVEDTSFTKKIGPDGRTYLLSGLFVRLIDKITAHSPLAIIVDDIQWMDSASWAITLNIMRRCKKALLVFTAGPCTDWREGLINRIRNAETEVIQIHGQSAKEIHRFLESKFENWAGEVDMDVAEAIKISTEGNQAFASCLTWYLQSIDSNTIAVSNGKLISHLGKSQFKSKIAPSFSELCLKIFDAQAPQFQKILKIAAVVGIQFSIEEVTAVFIDGFTKNYTSMLENLLGLVQIYDADNLIECKDSQLFSKTPITEYKYICAFRNSEMKDAIYTSRITEEERGHFHMLLAHFAENKLNSKNEPTYIPRICYHYSLAHVNERDSILQMIQYQVMYGAYLCHVAEMYKEAILIYTRAREIIEKFELEDVVGPTVISEIYLQMGHAYRFGLPEEVNQIQSLRYLMLAIDTLEFKWPRSNSDWIWLFAREVSLWGWVGFINLFKNKKEISKSKKKRPKLLRSFFEAYQYARNQKLDRLEQLKPIFENMSKNLNEMDARLRDQIGADLLILNHSHRMGLPTKSSSKLLLSFATSFWFSGYKKLSLRLATPTIEKQKEERKKDLIDSSTYSASAYYWTVAGHWNHAYTCSENGMDQAKAVGDYNTWQVCIRQLGFLEFFNGNFGEVVRIEKERIKESKLSGFSKHESSGKLSGLQEQKQSSQWMNEIYKEMDNSHRAQIQAIFSHVELNAERFQKSLDYVERVIDLLAKLHHTNVRAFIPIFLCCVSMYSIVERVKTKKNQKHKKNNTLEMAIKRKSTLKEPTNMKRSLSSSSTSEMIVRHTRGASGEINFDYRQARNTSSPLSPTKSAAEIVNTRIKALATQMISTLAIFKDHIIAEPLIILFKALAKLLDYNSVPSATSEKIGPVAMREYVQRWTKTSPGYKLLVAVVAIKCWIASNENLDYTSDLNVGMAMLAELGMDGTSVF